MNNDFLFMADAHIKARTWTNSTLLQGDAYAALDKLSASPLSDTLVIGGDWYDTVRPSAEDVQHSNDFISGFKQVYYVRGNHDGRETCFLDLLPGAEPLGEQPAIICGHPFCGVHYTSDPAELLE